MSSRLLVLFDGHDDPAPVQLSIPFIDDIDVRFDSLIFTCADSATDFVTRIYGNSKIDDCSRDRIYHAYEAGYHWALNDFLLQLPDDLYNQVKVKYLSKL